MKQAFALNFLLLLSLGALFQSCGFKAKPQSELLDDRPAIPFRMPKHAKQEKDNLNDKTSPPRH